jgi:hypothetical protein
MYGGLSSCKLGSPKLGRSLLLNDRWDALVLAPAATTTFLVNVPDMAASPGDFDITSI